MKRTFYLITLLLTACNVGPNYHVPLTCMPAHFSENKPHLSDYESCAWYCDLNDAVLTDLIKRAICGSNLDIQVALANIRLARAQLGVANASFFPQLDMTGKVTRDRLSANSEVLSAFPTGLIPLSYTDYKFEFDASWEIDIFGHTRRTVEASCARLGSNIENQRNVSIVTAAEVARIYTLYRTYQQRIIIAKNTINSYAETAQLVRLQLQAGKANVVDLNRAESELLSAKASLPPLQAEAKATLASLAVLVGELPECLFHEINDTLPIPVFNHHKICVGLPSDILRNRPDIRMAERELAAATADVGVAVSNLFPRFKLIGDIGSDTTIPGTYFHKASIFWSGGPQISMPIFHGGSLINTVKAQEAARDAALAQYKKTILQALADVESSLVRYHKKRVETKELQASYKKLKSVLRLVKLQYRDGKISLLNVLDVERQLYQIHDQYVQSKGQDTINLVSLYKSLGGAWVCA